jgi:hypothetical protein
MATVVADYSALLAFPTTLSPVHWLAHPRCYPAHVLKGRAG